MEPLLCPRCECVVVKTTYKFCNRCGCKLPLSSDLERSMFEVDLDEMVGITDEVEQEECNDECHAHMAKMLKTINRMVRGNKEKGPTPITHCHKCGKKLPEIF
ncbi:MAG: hypothetical protein AAB361_03930 [Patescibacteria group bacterium]